MASSERQDEVVLSHLNQFSCRIVDVTECQRHRERKRERETSQDEILHHLPIGHRDSRRDTRSRNSDTPSGLGTRRRHSHFLVLMRIDEPLKSSRELIEAI